MRSVTSQNDAAPKPHFADAAAPPDQLPVKTTLLQNIWRAALGNREISYQSKRRCSKTSGVAIGAVMGSVTSQNDAAPKLEINEKGHPPDQLPVKTTLLQNRSRVSRRRRLISYQSKRRCSKTHRPRRRRIHLISYQSKRRCSKTNTLSLHH